MNGSVVLIGGGARSGKSSFALARAAELGEKRAFVATAQAFDGEMTARIARHVREREVSFDKTFEPTGAACVTRGAHRATS